MQLVQQHSHASQLNVLHVRIHCAGAASVVSSCADSQQQPFGVRATSVSSCTLWLSNPFGQLVALFLDFYYSCDGT